MLGGGIIELRRRLDRMFGALQGFQADRKDREALPEWVRVSETMKIGGCFRTKRAR